jgi:hypothetical protein
MTISSCTPAFTRLGATDPEEGLEVFVDWLMVQLYNTREFIRKDLIKANLLLIY